MKHMFKVILAMALSLLLSLSMFALADGDVPEAENQVEEWVADVEAGANEVVFVEATSVEPASETYEEIEADLPELDVEAPEEAPVDEAPAAQAPADEAPADAEPVEEESPVQAPAKEQTADAEPAEEEPAAQEPIEEQSTEESAEPEPIDEQPADVEPAEQALADALPADEESAIDGESIEEAPVVQVEHVEEAPTRSLPVARALVYNGEPQALVEADEGWRFSTDGETYAAEPPVALNAGEYIVYCVPADDAKAEPVVLTVTIDKADVLLTPPVPIVF